MLNAETRLRHMLDAVGDRAREAASSLALTGTAVKDGALLGAAAALESASDTILESNRADVDAARAHGAPENLLDRLALNGSRLAEMSDGLRVVAGLPDPVGETVEGWRRPNGLEIRKVRVPLGVVAVIYEARPNVTSDVIGLCIKSGNAAILRGSTSAARSNLAIVEAIVPALTRLGLPAGSVQLIREGGRGTARELMRMRGSIDLLVPRGGPALVHEVVENATVPYVIDGDGNCHIYVDKAADLDKALRIVVNAKVSRPSVCNSAEKLLIHRDVAVAFLPRVAQALMEAGVELRGDAGACRLVPEMSPAGEEDWSTEYLGMIMAVALVGDIDGAVAHIRRYASGHTEAIVTEDLNAARTFVDSCPSAVVMVNASTRFTDGGEFGFGAEIGNSTQRLHARGPMGLRELTTHRYEVWGDGQIRE